MQKRKNPKSKKPNFLIVTIIIFTILLTWLVGFVTEREMRYALLLQTQIGANSVDVSYVKKLSGTPADLESPYYLKLKQQLANIKSVEENLYFVYLMGVKDGKVFFYVDDRPDGHKEGSPPGSPYDEAPDEFSQVMQTAVPVVEGPSADSWGSFASGCAPIIDPESGEVIAIFAIDFATKSWYRKIIVRSALPASLLISLIIGLFSIQTSKRRGELLTISENKYRFMFENNPQPNWIFDMKSLRFLEVNEAAVIHYGYSREEFLSMTIKDIRPAEDIPALLEDINDSHKTYNKSGEWRHVKKNGEVIFVEMISHSISLNGRNARHVLIHDITDRKLAEKELLDSEMNFRRSISESPVGIRIITIEGDTIYANKTYLDLFGFNSLEEFVNTPAKNRYTPESYVQHQERKQKRKSGQEISDYEISIVGSNGKISHVKVSRKEVLWNGEKHFQVINLDVTEQRNVEDQLRKLSIAVEQSPDAICITDPDGIIEYVNPRTLELTGYITDELIGMKTSIFKSDDKPSEDYAELWQTIKSGKVWSGELHNKKKNGELYWEMTTISPIFDHQEKITHFLAIKVDISERKRVEVELNNYKEQLEKFASHIQNVREEEKVALAREIHDDLGQILVALKIDIGLLKRNLVKTNTIRESVNPLKEIDNITIVIDKAIKSARRIMNGLRPELLELYGLDGATNEYLREFELRNQIKCEFISDIADIEIDHQQSLALYRIFQEVLNNIVRHANASNVKVQFSKQNSILFMEITDDGIGFDRENSGKPDSYGIIGMKERVTLLEGALKITSEPGRGTTVRVEVPFI